MARDASAPLLPRRGGCHGKAGRPAYAADARVHPAVAHGRVRPHQDLNDLEMLLGEAEAEQPSSFVLPVPGDDIMRPGPRSAPRIAG
jgi:hypothetical protein